MDPRETDEMLFGVIPNGFLVSPGLHITKGNAAWR